MNVGDRVRHIHGQEEGIVIRIMPNGQIEVEVEDGFRLPFVRSQLTLVSAAEAQYFKTATTFAVPDAKLPIREEVYAIQGIYMAFVHRNDQELELFLLNNTDQELLFTFGEEQEGIFAGVASGTLPPRKSQKVHNLTLAKFERWPTLVWQILRFKRGTHTALAPLQKKQRFKASQFHKTLQDLPILGKDGYLFQMDAHAETKPIDIASIQEAISHNQGGIGDQLPAKPKVQTEIDLHIESLVENHKGMSNADMLQRQLNAFETALDRAIMAGLHEIIFIHGVGSGVLRSEIQKILSKHPRVRFFEDARREKFGYGATSVSLK